MSSIELRQITVADKIDQVGALLHEHWTERGWKSTKPPVTGADYGQ